MGMKRKSLNENQIRTILAVFSTFIGKPYEEVNKELGSLTIEEMLELFSVLNNWYQPNVLGKRYDEEMGWIDDTCVY